MASGGEAGPSRSMELADVRKEAPHPSAPVRDVGKEEESYVKKMVDCLMNLKNHKMIFAKEDDDPLYSVAKRLLGQLYNLLASPVDRVGDWEAVCFDARLVTKLATEALFHGWDLQEGRSGSPSQSDDGTRSGMGGEVLSKSIKLEVLAHIESMASSDRAALDREMEVEMESVVASGGVDPNECGGTPHPRYALIIVDDKNIQVRRSPVCGNVPESAVVDNVVIGSKTSDNLSLVVTCNEEKSLDVAAGGVPCSLGTNTAVLEVFHAQAVGEVIGLADEPVLPISDPLVLNSIRRPHIDCAGLSNYPAMLDCGGPVGSQPACVNAIENAAAAVADGFVLPQAHAACGLVVVEDVERGFLPPVPGTAGVEVEAERSQSRWGKKVDINSAVSTFGHPLYFDIPSASLSRIAYARCCVEVAIDKVLPDFVTCVGGDKVIRRQQILYEWVPKRCSNCMAFGHLATACDRDGQVAAEQGNKKNGGQHSRASNEKFAMEGPRGVGSKEDHEGTPIHSMAHDASIVVEELDGILGDASKDNVDINLDDDPTGATQQKVDEEEGDEDHGNGKSENDRTSCASKEAINGVGKEDDISLPPSNCREWEGYESENQDGDALELQEILDSRMNKKAKRKKKKLAPIRPADSRTTHHSGSTPLAGDLCQV